MSDKDKRKWEEELKKCISSPYYFYINYVKIVGPDGEQRPATTILTEEEFNNLPISRNRWKDIK